MGTGMVTKQAILLVEGRRAGKVEVLADSSKVFKGHEVISPKGDIVYTVVNATSDGSEIEVMPV